MLNETERNTTAARLHYLRTVCSLTQDTLSLAAGIDRSTLSYYENGQVYPSMARLCMLATLYGITLDELLGEDTKTTRVTFSDSGDLLAEKLGDPVIPDMPKNITTLKPEEQLLVLLYRQLLEEGKTEFLEQLSKTVSELQLQLLENADEDILLCPEIPLPPDPEA